MKKTIALVAALMLCVSLVACGGEGADGRMKDGTYIAEANAAYYEGDGHGWKDILAVTYKDGLIIDAVFDSEYMVGDTYPQGTMKSSLSAEQYPMDVPPGEWIPELSDNIVTAGNADAIVAVAGATSASNNAKALLEAIEKNGKPGETIEVAL